MKIHLQQVKSNSATGHSLKVRWERTTTATLDRFRVVDACISERTLDAQTVALAVETGKRRTCSHRTQLGSEP
jgi:hypothetical protein